ncbi:MAG: cytochrome-c oxidase, cbb3-type subunit III [Alphaproteobacteria bacterium]|nr:cytochrome-c oxidase, cbb3-type subunit III [Alphaproteobacteria bacterium]
MPTKAEKDEFSGTETTGHEWDGIRELNTPLPRWWVSVFIICVIWAVGYWIVMPAWPGLTGHTSGVIGYSQRATVARQVEEARASRAPIAARVAGTPLAEIERDPELLTFALAAGQSAFAVNCVQCHGAGGVGAKGFPILIDDSWIWGGTLSDIEHTLTVGIRSGHADSRDNQMPAFLTDELLSQSEIRDVARFVHSLSDGSTPRGNGTTLFADNCAACHGDRGEGSAELGAPRLSDPIWLYGGDLGTIVETISRGRSGVMPSWDDRLDKATLRSLAVYVHSLGGGQ